MRYFSRNILVKTSTFALTAGALLMKSHKRRKPFKDKRSSKTDDDIQSPNKMFNILHWYKKQYFLESIISYYRA